MMVFSRIVVNSSKKLGVTKDTGQNEIFMKRSDNKISNNSKVGNGAGDTVQCFNRFSVFTVLEEMSGANSH